MRNFWLTQRLERVAQVLQTELENTFIGKDAKSSARQIYLAKLDFLTRCGLSDAEIKKIKVEVKIKPDQEYDGVVIKGIITGFEMHVLD